MLTPLSNSMSVRVQVSTTKCLDEEARDSLIPLPRISASAIDSSRCQFLLPPSPLKTFRQNRTQPLSLLKIMIMGGRLQVIWIALGIRRSHSPPCSQDILGFHIMWIQRSTRFAKSVCDSHCYFHLLIAESGKNFQAAESKAAVLQQNLRLNVNMLNLSDFPGCPYGVICQMVYSACP